MLVVAVVLLVAETVVAAVEGVPVAAGAVGAGAGTIFGSDSNDDTTSPARRINLQSDQNYKSLKTWTGGQMYYQFKIIHKSSNRE